MAGILTGNSKRLNHFQIEIISIYDLLHIFALI